MEQVSVVCFKMHSSGGTERPTGGSLEGSVSPTHHVVSREDCTYEG
jgi:hypothetical protein